MSEALKALLGQATKRPWKATDERLLFSEDDTEMVADVTDTSEGLEGDCPTADANAALIAIAVNHLEALVAFLEREIKTARHGQECVCGLSYLKGSLCDKCQDESLLASIEAAAKETP